MPTRTNEIAELNDADITSPSNKKAKVASTTEPDFVKVLLECGVSELKGTDEVEKSGCVLEEGVTPQQLRQSIHGLLLEMDKSGADVDNAAVLETMESMLGSEGELDLESLQGKVKNGLLRKILLPLTSQGGIQDNMEDQFATQLSQMGNDLENEWVTYDSSLVKVLLRVEALQPTLLVCLITKLQEFAAMEQDEEILNVIHENVESFTCFEEIPRLIISHIRWMELILDPISLISAVLECITFLYSTLPDVDGDESPGTKKKGTSDSVSRSILLDLIATLPDIVDDGAMAEEPDLMEHILNTLRDVRVQDSTFLIPVLDAVSSLRFTTDEQIETIINDALEALESVSESWLFPSITKFLVQHVPRSDTDLCNKTIETFRRLRLGYEEDEEDSSMQRNAVHEKTDSEALMLEALVQGFMYRTDLTNALINAMKCTAPSQHGSADLWLLFCCASAPHNKNKIKQLIKAKTISGGFTKELIVDTMKGNGAALANIFQSSLLPLADELLRANERVARLFGSALYEEMYIEFNDRSLRQDIVGQLIIHVASGLSYDEVDTAFRILCKLAQNQKTVNSLKLYQPFLLSLLENVQLFSKEHLRYLFLLLFTLGADTDSDDVKIVITKYLAIQQIESKLIAIIGAVSFACSLRDSQVEQIKEATTLLESVTKNCMSSFNGSIRIHEKINSISALSLFFDELCLAMKAVALPPAIKAWILDRFSGCLEDTYFRDLDQDKSSKLSLVPTNDADKALTHGKHPKMPRGELRYNLDGDDAILYLKLLSLHEPGAEQRTESAENLCSLLRILSIAFEEKYGGDGIDNIDALLGCPLLLPQTDLCGIDFTHMSEIQKLVTVQTLFSAVSWCREIVNAFIFAASFGASEGTQATQDQDQTRKKVVQKLNAMMELEEELVICSRKCYNFAPPGKTPLTVPRELLKLSNEAMQLDEGNGSGDDENEIDNIGRMTKEEKKAYAAIKKAAKKKEADRLKSKQKALKMKVKFEDEIEESVRSSLSPLSLYVCLALGFQELRIGNTMGTESSQDLVLSMGASELKNLIVGSELTSTLLRLFRKGLDALFRKEGIAEQGLEELKGNPYSMRCTSSKTRQKDPSLEFLGLCIEHDVFVSLYERLVSCAEILGDDEIEKESKVNAIQCTLDLMKCLTTILSIDEIHTKQGRAYFEVIIKQIAVGERQSAKIPNELRRYPFFASSADKIFSLLEEAITGNDIDQIDFTMTGVECVEALVLRAEKIQMFEEMNKIKGNMREEVTKMKLRVSSISLDLLKKEWHERTSFNKQNVGKLLRLYLDFSACGSSISTNGKETQSGRLKALDVLIKEALCELPSFEGCKGPVDGFPTCNKVTFGLYFSAVLNGINSEISQLFQLPSTSEPHDVDYYISILEHLVGLNLKLSNLTKENPALAKTSNLLLQLKSGNKFIDIIVKKALPFCAKNYKNFGDRVLTLIKETQEITKQMNYIISHGKRTKEMVIVKEAPKVRKVCEGFIHHTKSLLAKNSVEDIFWSGNVKNRNIDGSIIAEEDKDSESGDDESSDTESEGEN